MSAGSEKHLLEWVTVAGNRYELPTKITEQGKTAPFLVDSHLGEGHLEFDKEPLGGNYLPGKDQLIVVNVRAILAAKERIQGLPTES